MRASVRLAYVRAACRVQPFRAMGMAGPPWRHGKGVGWLAVASRRPHTCAVACNADLIHLRLLAPATQTCTVGERLCRTTPYGAQAKPPSTAGEAAFRVCSGRTTADTQAMC